MNREPYRVADLNTIGGGTVGGYDWVLLDEAKLASERARQAFEVKANAREAGAAAAAILCAAAACEARLSEHIGAIETDMDYKLTEELESIRTNPNAREQWKKLLAYARLEFDCGSSPEYRALGCLFKLRNAIAHRDARVRELGTWQRLASCIAQRTIPVRQAERADWTSIVFVHEVARWAYETAEDWVQLVDQLLPLKWRLGTERARHRRSQ